MRRKGPLIVNATFIAMLSTACGSGASADRTETSTTSTATVAVTPRDTAAGAPIESVANGTSTVPTPDAKGEDTVAQPIACTPTTFGPGDTLTLRMGTPHGDQLSIHSPDRTTYSLVYPTIGQPKRNYSLIPSEEFRKIGILPLTVDVRAIPLVKGRDTILEPVFAKPGKYTIVMGENLASDYSNRSTYCTVTFLSQSKQ